MWLQLSLWLAGTTIMRGRLVLFNRSPLRREDAKQARCGIACSVAHGTAKTGKGPDGIQVASAGFSSQPKQQVQRRYILHHQSCITCFALMEPSFPLCLLPGLVPAMRGPVPSQFFFVDPHPANREQAVLLGPRPCRFSNLFLVAHVHGICSSSMAFDVRTPSCQRLRELSGAT